MTTTPSSPAPLLWTLDDYHHLIDTGLLAARRVQLIEGQLIEMPPMNTPHIGAMSYLHQTLVRSAVGDRVFSQTPILIDPQYGPPTEPEPDVYVAKPGASLKPRIDMVDLIIEISDSTVADDRRRKVGVYLAAAAREIWLVDLVAEHVTVWRAAKHTVYSSSAAVTPLLKPEMTIELAAVFAAARRP